MILKINNQELSILYNKAKENYLLCVNNKDNSFLQKEISLRLEDIKIINSNIKIVFSNEISNEYLIEVSLSLWENSVKCLGNYVSVQDVDGNLIDDRLVFF